MLRKPCCLPFSRRFSTLLRSGVPARLYATGGTPDKSETDDAEATDASLLDVMVEDSTPAASSRPSSSSPRAVEVEEEGHHEARRQLFSAALRVRRAVQKELRDEVARDAEDGVAALPPLAPAGWAVHHHPGHRYFVMTKELHQPTRDDDADAAEEGGSSGPRYRSVHDTLFAGADKKQPHQRDTAAAEAQQWVLQKGGGYSPAGDLRPLSDYSPSNKLGAAHVTRSRTRLTLYAPFRVLDLSLFNNDVPIVEHSTFDVLVHKCKPRRRRDRVQLDPQQKVWDDETALFVSLASVNSELRIRHLQFLSRPLTRALREQALFGAGDPHFEALVQRQEATLLGREAEQAQRLRRRQEAHHRRRARGQQQQRQQEIERPPPAQPSTRVVQPGDLGAAPPDIGTTHYELNKERAQEGHLVKHFGVVGDYARLYGYSGPHITELSKELQESLLQYLAVDLGINEELREYVCQSQYVMEQEEYTQWLARWDQVAEHLQRRL